MIGLDLTLDDRVYSYYCRSVKIKYNIDTATTKYWFVRNHNERGDYQYYYDYIINKERKEKLLKIKSKINDKI